MHTFQLTWFYRAQDDYNYKLTLFFNLPALLKTRYNTNSEFCKLT